MSNEDVEEFGDGRTPAACHTLSQVLGCKDAGHSLSSRSPYVGERNNYVLR